MANQVIVDLCQYLKLDPIRFASEMENAPYASKSSKGDNYPSGTGETIDRMFLYALVRMLMPEVILEIGTGWGAFTTQLLSACMNNNKGTVYSSEVVARQWNRPVGSMIPESMTSRLQTTTDGTWLVDKADFILEDSDHTYDTTKAHWLRGMAMLPEGGVMLSHDATNKPEVLKAVRDCGVSPLIVQLEPGIPDFALWQKPAQEKTVAPPMSKTLTTAQRPSAPKAGQKPRHAKT